jgi:superfamily II DNA or RNA helicase
LRDQKDKNDHKRLKDNTPVPLTIARIFATWSMMKVDLSSKDEISIDFQPHPAQIVAIYLLTGLSDTKLSNALVEVLTGEGKSIVLAGLCCYLALKGYYPYCACYS